MNALRHWALVATTAFALCLTACSSNPPAPVVDLSPAEQQRPPQEARGPAPRGPTPGSYVVVRGDTLYAIAFKHGLDYRDVAAWNRIQPPYRIYAGQELRLDGATMPARAPPPVVAAPTPSPADTSPKAPPPGLAPNPTPIATAPAPHAGPGMFEDVPPEPVARTPEPETHAPAPPPPASSSAASTPSTQLPPFAATPVAPPAEQAARPQTPPSPARSAPPPADDSIAVSANGIAWRWPGRGSLIGTYVGGDQTRQGIDIAGNAGDPVLAAADGEVVYSGNGLLGYGELIIVKHSANFLSAYGHNRKRLVQEGQRIKGGQQIAEMGSSASARDELHFEIRKNGKPVNPLDYLPAR